MLSRNDPRFTTAHKANIQSVIIKYLNELNYVTSESGNQYQPGVRIQAKTGWVRIEVATQKRHGWMDTGYRITFDTDYEAWTRYIKFRKWIGCKYNKANDVWTFSLDQMVSKLQELIDLYDQAAERYKANQNSRQTNLAKVRAMFPGYEVREDSSDYILTRDEVVFTISLRSYTDQIVLHSIELNDYPVFDSAEVANGIIEVLDKFKLED